MSKKQRKLKPSIQVYTDGAYDQGRRVGGYGAVIFAKIGEVNRMKKFPSSVSYVDTTSNRMEIRAILACLKRIDPGYNIDIYTDSQYCVKMFNNIKNSYYNMRLPANKDLWKQVREQWLRHINKGSYIHVNWVRGHAGNPLNEMADKLANIGANRAKKVVCDQNKHTHAVSHQSKHLREDSHRFKVD